MEHMGNYRMFAEEPISQPVDELANAPAVPLPLVEFLEQLFPNVLPMQHLSDWDLGRKVGQQEILVILRQIAGRRT